MQEDRQNIEWVGRLEGHTGTVCACWRLDRCSCSLGWPWMYSPLFNGCMCALSL